MNQKVGESVGLDYFPLECAKDAEINKALKLVTAEFGMQAYGIVIMFFQKIYGEKGYYCDCNKDVLTLFSYEHGEIRSKKGNSVSLLNEILNCCVRRGVFSKEQYEKNHILTSQKIQENFLRATKRRKIVEMKKAYLLVNVALLSENVVITEENQSQNVSNFEQSFKDKNYKKNIYVTAPTLEEVKQYAVENGLKTDIDKFYAYYAKNGWVDSNGNQIRDWKAALSYWLSYKKNAKKSSSGEKVSGQKQKNKFHKFEERPTQQDELLELERMLIRK